VRDTECPRNVGQRLTGVTPGDGLAPLVRRAGFIFLLICRSQNCALQSASCVAWAHHDADAMCRYMQAHRRKLIYRGLCNETCRSAESGFERCGDINGGDITDVAILLVGLVGLMELRWGISEVGGVVK
jgi:hypothetical protein